MSTDWKTRSFSANSTAVEVDPLLLDEEIVILLQGTNVFGDIIFSYIKMTLRNLQALRDSLKRGDKFMPADFGTVLAAGKGEPSRELKSEMAVTYQMVDVPMVRSAKANAAPKKKLGSFAGIQYSPEE